MIQCPTIVIYSSGFQFRTLCHFLYTVTLALPFCGGGTRTAQLSDVGVVVHNHSSVVVIGVVAGVANIETSTNIGHRMQIHYPLCTYKSASVQKHHVHQLLYHRFL